MPSLPAKNQRRCNFSTFFFLFFLFLFFHDGFVLEEEEEEGGAVNKHGHDSVEVLPVPIKQQRDHGNER